MNKNLVLIGVMSVCLLCFGSCNQDKESKKENSKAPEISFAETEFDFGELEYGSEATHEFEFTNTGSKPLILNNVKPACGCTVAKWTKDPINPGGKSSIEVRFATRSVGRFVKSINVSSNAENAEIVLKIKGSVVKAPTE
jgi:hypothetical protein